MRRVREVRSGHSILSAALCAAALLAIVPAAASHAAVYEGTYSASVTGQSMWGEGSADAIQYSQFFGTSWNRSLSVGDVADTWLGSYGAELYGHTQGRIGFDVGASVSSGTVDITQLGTIMLDAPELIYSNQQLVVSSASLLGTGSISTQSPTASAYVDLVLELEADVSGRGCVVGCVGASGTLVNIDAHPELLAVNNEELRILGVNSGALPLQTSIGPIDVTVTAPYVATSGSAPPQPLSSSGTSDFIDMSLDVANLASTSLGVPLSASLGPIGYSLFSAGLGLDLGIYQDFAFSSNTPEITLAVAETGLSYSFLAGQVSPVIDPMGNSLLHISSSIDFSGILNNDTGIQLSPYVYMDILSLSAFGGELGPVYAWRSEFGNYPISMFDRDISVDFNSLAGPSFQVAVAPGSAPVPEPGTLVLFGSGLASLAGFYRRRGLKRKGVAK